MKAIYNLIVLSLVLLHKFLVVSANNNPDNFSLEDNQFSTRRVATTQRSPIIPRLSHSYKYICQEDKQEIERSRKNLGIRCRCPMIYAPVCGSDNVTYHNRCFMHCRATHAKDLYHRYRLTLKKFGEC